MTNAIRRRAAVRLICVVAIAGGAGTAARAADAPPADAAAVRAAVARSLPLLATAARTSAERRSGCFTCHNQGAPIQAMAAAAARGFAVDREVLKAQAKFTADFLGRNRANYLEGQGQGGQAHTAGYALWALENAGWQPDETTAAVAEYLLQFEKEADHWRPQSSRPPTQRSHFATSYVALRGLERFGTAVQQERIKRRRAQVRAWLRAAAAKDTEDRVFRLLALRLTGAAAADVAAAADDLRRTQRPDGGWAQLESMPSDAYATATALFALREAGGLTVADPADRAGVRFLLAAQLPDGSWHVATRSEPLQKYYESGYPHGKDQFISVAAAGWATTVLAMTVPEPGAAAP
ncbi:MAG TPA: prenyltransferase/squalene oxidase repeat-containing protein [Humisphaera sp.]